MFYLMNAASTHHMQHLSSQTCFANPEWCAEAKEAQRKIQNR